MPLLASLPLLLCLLVHTPPSLAQSTVVVTVDPDNGNDSLCVSAQERRAALGNVSNVPCATINRALGNVSCETCANDESIRDTVVRLATGVHTLGGCIGITGSLSVRVEAVMERQAIIECGQPPSTDTFNNIFVCEVNGITFSGVIFENCGPVSPNVFLNSSSNISFEGCVFRNNTGAPLQAQFCHDLRVVNTDFLSNTNQLPAEPDVGVTSINDIYSGVTVSGGITFFSRDIETEILLQGCRFLDNSANRNDVNNTRPVLLKVNGHGGAVLIRLAEVQNSYINISDCVFENNRAEVDGGAVYLSLSESTESNVVTVSNSTFYGNEVELASGGAISINSFNFTRNNIIVIENCNFTRNRGSAGGAVSVVLYDTNFNNTLSPDSVNFNQCQFSNNAAVNEGTAVGLFSLVHVDQIGFPVSFHDCVFRNNTSLDDTRDKSAVAAFRFPTSFSGTNAFTDNVGGGITLLNAPMNANGTLLFENNIAVFGGGIAMDDRCLLQIHPGVSMTFLGNTALESGGGIYVEFPPVRFVVDIFNRLCFLQYSDGTGSDVPPQEWQNVSISFINNTARLSGAAIYASDMQQCRWVGNETTDESYIFLDGIVSPSPFSYRHNSLFQEGSTLLSNVDLATSPSQILPSVEYTRIQPGEMLPIDLLALDQVNNRREAVWSLESPNSMASLGALSSNNDTYLYEVPTVARLFPQSGQPSSTLEMNFSSSFGLNFSLLRTLGTPGTVNLQILGCHPGFILDPKSDSCVCDSSNGNILRCDDNNRYLFLREGIWGGTDTLPDGTQRLITARVQPGYVNCQPEGRLPGCRFKFDQQDVQCRTGRKGLLCGTCVDGHGVTLDLQTCSSTSCTAGLVLFVFFCVLIVVLCVLILYFNVGLPNELKGFLLYAQVIGLVYRPYSVVKFTNTSIDWLGVLLNLLGFSLPIPLCLSTSLKANHVALLGYITPILAILTILGYVIAVRFIKSLSDRSALKGLIFLSLFVYKYIADASFIFISCLSTDFGLVFQYDGSVQCTSFEFVFFSLIGLILVVFFVVPIPFVSGFVCVKRPLRFIGYVDVITKGLVKKYRWWGGFDIGRRLPFVFIAYFVVLARPSLVLFFMSLAALLMLIVHLIMKPYERLFTNIVEAAILLDLLMITATFLDPSNSPVPDWFSIVLILLPYFYCFGWILWNIIYYFMNRMKIPLLNKLQAQDQNDSTEAPGGSAETELNKSADPASNPNPARDRSSTFNNLEESEYCVLREPLLDDI